MFLTVSSPIPSIFNNSSFVNLYIFSGVLYNLNRFDFLFHSGKSTTKEWDVQARGGVAWLQPGVPLYGVSPLENVSTLQPPCGCCWYSWQIRLKGLLFKPFSIASVPQPAAPSSADWNAKAADRIFSRRSWCRKACDRWRVVGNGVGEAADWGAFFKGNNYRRSLCQSDGKW